MLGWAQQLKGMGEFKKGILSEPHLKTQRPTTWEKQISAGLKPQDGI
jgi:hypothetical protein